MADPPDGKTNKIKETSSPAGWLAEHGDVMFGYARRRVPTTDIAEELIQDALLAALQAWPGFQGDSSVRTWLIGILHHKVLDHYRRESSRRPNVQIDESDPVMDAIFKDGVRHEATRRWNPTAEDTEARRRLSDALGHCLDALPSTMRQALCLRELDGLASEEICKILNISTTNLWVLLHRARTRMRVCMDQTHFRPDSAGHLSDHR